MVVRLHRDQRIELLKGVDLFAGCTKEQLRQIASLSTELDVRTGQVLAEQGQLGLQFFVIIEGTAQASRNGIVLATLTPTDFFGELALLDGGGRTATVVAETDMRLLVLTRAEFNQLCRSYPSVSQRMLAVIGGRLRRADEMLGRHVGTIPLSDSPCSHGQHGTSLARHERSGRQQSAALCVRSPKDERNSRRHRPTWRRAA